MAVREEEEAAKAALGLLRAAGPEREMGLRDGAARPRRGGKKKTRAAGLGSRPARPKPREGRGIKRNSFLVS